MKKDEVLDLYGQEYIDRAMLSCEKEVRDSIIRYGEPNVKFSEIIVRQERRGTYIISLAHGIAPHNPKTAVFRYHVKCFSTYETLALDGNVYDTKWAEKVDFQYAVDKVIGSMKYHIKKLSIWQKY
jgi:hypothetical protein